MKNKIIIILLSIFISAFLYCYYIYFDHLPPRTPFKLARLATGLTLPSKIDVIDFNSIYSPSGGMNSEYFQLNSAGIEDIIKQIKEEIEPINANFLKSEGINFITTRDSMQIEFQIIEYINKGFYKLTKHKNRKNKNEFTLILIDCERNRLLVFEKY